MVDFIKEAETIQQQVVLWRRDLHQCPELLLDLPKTSAYVERELQKMGYETERICQSGLTTVLDSGKPGKTLLLRADMDGFRYRRKVDFHMQAEHLESAMHAAMTHIWQFFLGLPDFCMSTDMNFVERSNLCFNREKKEAEAPD